MNLVGGWATWRPQLGYVGNSSATYQHLSGAEKEENIHKQIAMVREYQACGYKYVYMVRTLPWQRCRLPNGHCLGVLSSTDPCVCCSW